jgi:hypothetical protein
MVAGYVPPGGDKRKLKYEARCHLWEDPYIYRVCADGLLRKCVPMVEAIKIIERFTHHPMEDIMEHSAQMQRSGKVDFSGQRCIKIQRSLLEDVPDIKNLET